MPLNCRSYFHPEPESEESLAFANIGDKAAWPLIEQLQCAGCHSLEHKFIDHIKKEVRICRDYAEALWVFPSVRRKAKKENKDVLLSPTEKFSPPCIFEKNVIFPPKNDELKDGEKLTIEQWQARNEDPD